MLPVQTVVPDCDYRSGLWDENTGGYARLPKLHQRRFAGALSGGQRSEGGRAPF